MADAAHDLPQPRRLSKTSLFRILPAAFVGLLPFALLDDAVLKTQYALRGVRTARAQMLTVIAEDGAQMESLGRLAREKGWTCVSFVPLSLGRAPHCDTVKMAKRFEIDSYNDLWQRWSRKLNPRGPSTSGVSAADSSVARPTDSSVAAATTYRPLFRGGLEAFRPVPAASLLLQAEEPVAFAGHWSAVKVLALVPPFTSSEEAPTVYAFPVATPAGRMNPVEVALNVLADASEGTQLHTAPRWAQFLLSLATAVIVAWILYTYPISMTLIFVLILTAFGFVAGMVLFDKSGFQVPLAAPLFSLVTIYLLGMSDRLDRRERREWALQREAQQLQHLDELRNNFLSLVSHDLKTPVARMQSVLERFARGDFGALQPVQHESLQKLLSASGHLRRTISTLLLLGRIESRALHLQPTPTDLVQLLTAAVQENTAAAAERQITFRLETEPLFLVDLDQALIREVINNLIDNALRYTSSGTEVKVRCGELNNAPELSPPRPALWFEVQDFGPGIANEDRRRVLRKFTRARVELSSTAESVKGTGLGLYLSSFFVQKHGGRLNLFSRTAAEINGPVDQENAAHDELAANYFAAGETGTVFRVTLPLELSLLEDGAEL